MPEVLVADELGLRKMPFTPVAAAITCQLLTENIVAELQLSML